MEAEQCHCQLSLENLTQDILLLVLDLLPTETLISVAAAHEVFNDIITDTKFLDRRTRRLLGIPLTEVDITYDVVPSPVAPVQELWFLSYLAHADPNMAGIIRPGVVFYDLLCFKHLLDTWFLQATGFTYMKFMQLVFSEDHPVHTAIIKLRPHSIYSSIRRMLTKIALCRPEVLLKTVNNFELLNINFFEPADLDEAWNMAVPDEWKIGFNPQINAEVVSRDRGVTLASFLLTFGPESCIGWSGITNYANFRCQSTWAVCKLASSASLEELRGSIENFFTQFLDYLNPSYISYMCTSAFMYKGLMKLSQGKPLLVIRLQGAFEQVARHITKKIRKRLTDEQFASLINYLDSIRFMPSRGALAVLGEEDAEASGHIGASKTLEVAVERYIHRGMNRLIGREVLRYYSDPVCHRVLCLACHNRKQRGTVITPNCLRRVHPNCVPLKIWPTHLMRFALSVLPALEKIACLDIEMRIRKVMNIPPTPRVVHFAHTVLTAVSLTLKLEEGETGPLLGRVWL